MAPVFDRPGDFIEPPDESWRIRDLPSAIQIVYGGDPYFAFRVPVSSINWLLHRVPPL